MVLRRKIATCRAAKELQPGEYTQSMSGGRRAYDLLRGYINNEWDRIQGVMEGNAEQELNDALAGPRPTTNASPAPAEVVAVTEEETARQILGVGPDASFEDIKKAFDKLNQRSAPTNFPDDSPEAKQAEKIRNRVERAYRTLCDKFDSTETRFKSLEID